MLCFVACTLYNPPAHFALAVGTVHVLIMALPLTVLALLTVLAIAATATSGEYQMGQREAGR